MKRPSAWPLFGVLLLVGLVMAFLFYHDRLDRAQGQLADLQGRLEEQINRQQALQQALEEVQRLVDALQQELKQSRDRLGALSAQVERLSQQPPPQPPPSEDVDLADIVLWVLAVSGALLGLLGVLLG